MPSRDLTIHPYDLPGAATNTDVLVSLELVDSSGAPQPGYDAVSGTGVAGTYTATIRSSAVVIALPSTEGLTPSLYWRFKAQWGSVSGLRLYTSGLIELESAGGALTLPEFLSLAEIPGTITGLTADELAAIRAANAADVDNPFATLADIVAGGGGNVSKVGTPVDNQVGVWTGDGSIEGDADLTFDGSNLSVGGNIVVGGTVDGRDVASDGALAATALQDDDTLSTGLTFPVAGLHLLDTNASHDLIVSPGSDLTADRTLTLTTGDANRTLTLSGDATLTGTNTGDEADANATTKGIVELATTAETTTGTDAARAVTPDGLKDGYQGSTNVDTLGTITTGTWNGTAIEGTAIASTGEVGGSKFLREDGDDTCSWQAIGGGGDLLAANNLSDVAVAATAFSNIKQAASTTATGVVELATTAETTTGTDATRAVTPDGLQDGYQGSANVTTLGTITTGTWTGTDVAVAAGGTGASDAATARTNLGVGTMDNVVEDTTPQLGGDLDCAGNDLTDVQRLIIDATPDADHTATGMSTATINAGTTIAQSELVYLASDGEWALADADATGTTDKFLAVALEAGTDTNPMDVALPGSFVRDDTWTWTVGGAIYAGLTAGAMTQTAPSATDDVVRVVGYAVSADVMWFSPETGVVHG